MDSWGTLITNHSLLTWIGGIYSTILLEGLIFREGSSMWSEYVDRRCGNMKLFEVVKGLNRKKLHNKFLLLKNESQLLHEKNMLQKWSEGLVDKDNKFVREFQETFHSCFWELFLYRLFKSAGFDLDQSHQTPDFVIKKPEEVYVEAVIANISKSGKKESERTLEDQLSMMIPPYLQDDFDMVMREGILRAANAIQSKNNKWLEEYSKKEWICSDRPYIVAMSSYDQINYGREYIYSMLALLYGFYFNAKTETYEKKNSIIKPNTNQEAEIPIALLEREEYQGVSAIIFSCIMTLGKLTSLSISEGNLSLNVVYNIRENYESGKYLLQIVSKENPEDIADGVFIFHNPNAKNKLNENFFRNLCVTQFFLENGELVSLGNMTPIIARVNTSMILRNLIEPKLLENLRMYNKLSFEDFYDIHKR